MRLTDDEARSRLVAADHGVLATLHPERGVDAVPVVFTVDAEGYLAIPVDTVKPKASTTLQRERNLQADPRATLLVDHWDRADWSRLWWVRAELRWEATPDEYRLAGLAAALAARYPQYANEPFERLIVLRMVAIAGWSGDR